MTYLAIAFFAYSLQQFKCDW